MCNRTSVAKALSITTSHLKFVANGGMPAEIVALGVHSSVTSTYRDIPTYLHYAQKHTHTHTHAHAHTLKHCDKLHRHTHMHTRMHMRMHTHTVTLKYMH